jgi:filamentous hemagglutinin family protein
MNRTDHFAHKQHPNAVDTASATIRHSGIRSSTGAGKVLGPASLTLQALSASLLIALAMPAHAGGPLDGVVTAGQASIVTNGSTTTINQSSANVIINWQSFSIGAGDTVQFVQPGRSSVALNRVLGADPSIILGNLKSNGNVFLLHPNGILFGNGASVNVGGLVASTMRITDADFMAGHYAFANAGEGSIVNQGHIAAASGGYVALMGRNVSNQGVISARLGSVALAGGEAVTLDVAGDGL